MPALWWSAAAAYRKDQKRSYADGAGRRSARNEEPSERRGGLRDAVEASCTTLTDIYGVGPVVAGLLIGYTGDITRFPTRHHYTACNADAPIDASSGSNERRRLNPVFHDP